MFLCLASFTQHHKRNSSTLSQTVVVWFPLFAERYATVINKAVTDTRLLLAHVVPVLVHVGILFCPLKRFEPEFDKISLHAHSSSCISPEGRWCGTTAAFAHALPT